MPLSYSTTPPPRTAYGQVPGPIGVPPSTFAQLSGALPNFTRNLGTSGNVIGSQLAGDVSPQTLNALKAGAAQFGVASGMPGSGLEQNQLFGNIAGFSEAQQQKGLQNLLAQAGTFAPTMTNPNLAAEIAARNADLAAAPDPKLAAEQSFQDWLRGFQYTRAAATPAGPWAAGGTLGPSPGVVTTHSDWGGFSGITPPGAFSTPDAFGYNMPAPEPLAGTYTATATPPEGGWPVPQPWNAGFAVGSPYHFGGESNQPHTKYPLEEVVPNQGFESSEYATQP